MNTVNIIGRLVKDPVLRTDNGKSVCTFDLALDDAFSREDRADFIPVTVFGNQADNCMRFLRKGFNAGVQGRLRSDRYTDKQGIQGHRVSIICERCYYLQWPPRETQKSKPAQTETAETALPKKHDRDAR
jgi:single-strand DNA-binding protein